MIGTSTIISPARAKPTLHVECCTKQPEFPPAIVGSKFFNFRFYMGSKLMIPQIYSSRIKLKDGSGNAMLQSSSSRHLRALVEPSTSIKMDDRTNNIT